MILVATFDVAWLVLVSRTVRQGVPMVSTLVTCLFPVDDSMSKVDQSFFVHWTEMQHGGS